MHVSVLGETEVVIDGCPVDLSSRKLRQIVAGLALSDGRAVSYDALVELLWGEDLPEGLPGTLHAYIALLRKRLEPDRAPRTPSRLLVTVGTGYALPVPPEHLDATRFRRVVAEVDQRLATGDPLAAPALTVDDLEHAVGQLDEALGLWRGVAYADLDGADADAERARLDELRVLAQEARATARLALGGHATVVAELEALASVHPVRERLRVVHALALYAGGRQADALGVIRRYASELDEQLGIEPSATLRSLQVRILRQDPTLSWGPPRPVATQPSMRPHPATRAAPPLAPPRRDWPLAGRQDELVRLRGLLDRTVGGQASYAAVTGEPGIGKSRLCAELMTEAVGRGVRLLVGRCSQDDGAPPLWPWQQVLDALGHELVVEPLRAADEGAAFRSWEVIVGHVRDAARREPVLVVLDDLHWADAPTLRVLRLLVETLGDDPVMVLATWRSHPAPAGALADAAEALARAHAARLALTGLDAEASATLVGSVTGQEAGQDQAEELARRTDGNPFYLVEFARLAHDGDPSADLASAGAPAAVQDVVGRRLDQLSAPALATLRVAGVVGRDFDLPSLVAAADGMAEDDLLDHLDEAVGTGLVRERGPGQWSFGHALVRDAAQQALGPTRAARAHARLAGFLDALPGRETEAAHHWLAAGPAHARRAWQSATAAARVARSLHAHDDAARWLREALRASDQDPTVGDLERFSLLMDLADAERWSGQWARLLAASDAALDVAEALGDPALVGEAAAALTTGAFWQTNAYGEVHERHVLALRRALEMLPVEDAPRRCVLMSSLAMELYYVSGHEERTALLEQALAMARRLGDDGLVADTCLRGFVSQWRADTAEARLALVDEAAALATRLGDAHRLVTALTLRAVVLGELGRIGDMWDCERRARNEAERLRIPYSIVVLDGLVVPWLAMAGREAEAQAALARMQEASSRIVLFQTEEAVLGAYLSLQMWRGDLASLVEPMVALDAVSPLPTAAVVCQVLTRNGEVERARAFREEHLRTLPESHDWFTLLALAAAAETSLQIGDPSLAAEAYAQLAPFSGRTACAGSGSAQGPVDAFLAMAAAAVGDPVLATRHAADAEALMRQWGVERCASWFTSLRARLGF